jgi:hypothetical protein
MSEVAQPWRGKQRLEVGGSGGSKALGARRWEPISDVRCQTSEGAADTNIQRATLNTQRSVRDAGSETWEAGGPRTVTALPAMSLAPVAPFLSAQHLAYAVYITRRHVAWMRDNGAA